MGWKGLEYCDGAAEADDMVGRVVSSGTVKISFNLVSLLLSYQRGHSFELEA